MKPIESLELWSTVDDIDPRHTKAITGRATGGTSPNPTYLVKLATKHLGPAGKGFGWEVVAEAFEQLGDTTLHWCRLRFWWKDIGTGQSHFFEQYGQTKAAYPTRTKGLIVDEDAPKKSLTDALTKCLSYLGFAANIYLGRWDDNKYVAQVAESYRLTPENSRPAVNRPQAMPERRAEPGDDTDDPVTGEERQAFLADLHTLGKSWPELAGSDWCEQLIGEKWASAPQLPTLTRAQFEPLADAVGKLADERREKAEARKAKQQAKAEAGDLEREPVES